MYQRRNYKRSLDSEQQFHDDDLNDQLDHCKLYVKNISKALNQDGLKSLFSKYGNCIKVFLSNDPTKRYALVTYETPR
ncbi:unnamed protein product [Euphydryas editha]|uniref:RRM domain-containing protein n=1 Tax=Euphydryas editha TaxID=104508 RepID=A0AAU9T9J8_EUPED|nr:unnamed protein product [Euphydryas editha]